jgi:hypothetical protein
MGKVGALQTDRRSRKGTDPSLRQGCAASFFVVYSERRRVG